MLPYLHLNRQDRDNAVAYLLGKSSALLRVFAAKTRNTEITQIEALQGIDVDELINFLLYDSQPRHGTEIKSMKYKVGCIAGEQHEIEFYSVARGMEYMLQPNHRVNAMVHAGRFTTKEFNDIDKNARTNKSKNVMALTFVLARLYAW